jgi:hypothetical protein
MVMAVLMMMMVLMMTTIMMMMTTVYAMIIMSMQVLLLLPLLLSPINRQTLALSSLLLVLQQPGAHLNQSFELQTRYFFCFLGEILKRRGKCLRERW